MAISNTIVMVMITLQHFDGTVTITPLVGGKFIALSSDKRLYRKELIKVGEYTHDAEGYEFSITLDMLQHWADTFATMKANGVKVPIPSTHAGVGDPDKNRGYVIDMFVDGASLAMTCELIGEDALAAAERSDVSIGVPVDFVDGKGIKYLRPITHVAMVTDPVIPGLGDFIPLAASRAFKEKNVKKYVELVKALDLQGEVTDDNVVALVLAHNKGQAEKLIELTKHSASLEEKLKEKPPDKTKPAPDSVLLNLAADNRNMKLDALVQAAKITPDARKAFAKVFIGEDNKALILSLANGHDTFDDVIKVLALNDPVKLAETTRAQTLELSGVSNDDAADKDVLVKDAEVRAQAAKV